MAPAETGSPLLQEFHCGHPVNPTDVARGGRGRRAGGAGGSVLAVLRAAFLPEGYPASVSPDYISFQAWDTVQALCSYVRGMLTSAAIMRGVGVGEQASTPLAAVFTFFVRDMAGMLGGILFAYLEGSGFDSCAKQWRLFADVTNDLGMTVELASPLLPRSAFLPCAVFGSIARSVTGVAGGATRAALTQHFAVRGNNADVAAKEQSQETATTIIGMVVGMAVTRLLNAHPHPPAALDGAEADPSAAAAAAAAAARNAALAWLVFIALTVLHVWANVRAMRCLVLSSLNQPRLEILVDRYLRDGTTLGPVALSLREDLTPPPFRRLLDWATGAASRRPVHLHYGSRASAVLPGDHGRGGPHASSSSHDSHQTLEQLLVRQGRRCYLLIASMAGAGALRQRGGGGGYNRNHQPQVQVHVVLHRAAEPADQLRAFVHAHCLQHQVRQQQHQLASAAAAEGAKPAEVAAAAAGASLLAAERAADDWMATHYEALVSGLAAAGWQLGRVALPRPAWTAEWATPGAGTEAGVEAGAQGAARAGQREEGMLGGLHEA
ncbi:hypothetical protein HYH03_010832 [Edaphochlamys debaryana]|uniref:Uncharacterized protein n=1 Tax=Edaphochlamys debaryana TaxID=47281 RepID=A0A835XW60_9CHLO|nr:hypothetical protein HYH03_010832 [Edaphochlamys debaryana]|eukprot:KAG2490919.1 hypothetical protein HYH03_010832 [Edaphochlamys debaryana]